MTQRRVFTRGDLIGLTPRHDSFVGVDSDGCVFDTMEIKQKACFHPRIISHFHLEPAAAYVRETAEFVNLYSVWRGTNRFAALIRTFDLLRGREEVRRAGVRVPRLRSLAGLVASGEALGHPALEAAVVKTGDPDLESVLEWSRAVNADIERKVGSVPPFAGAREGLESVRMRSDLICVSQTPAEALMREWEAHGLLTHVAAIAGQELGTKAQQIAMAAGGRYARDRVLIIGDAQGDKRAAGENGALFYPVNPGGEESSWRRFREEAYGLFLAGKYAGAYEEERIAEFDALLPAVPPWDAEATPQARRQGHEHG